MKVMSQFLDDYYGMNVTNESSVNVGVNSGVQNVQYQKDNAKNMNRNVIFTQNTQSIPPAPIMNCFRCGKLGHSITECRLALGSCFGCGQIGHMIRDCQNRSSRGCRQCGQPDHWISNCPQGARTNACGNCGQRGHFSRMCPSPRNLCTKCGRLGHLTQICRNVTRQEGNVPSVSVDGQNEAIRQDMNVNQTVRGN